MSSLPVGAASSPWPHLGALELEDLLTELHTRAQLAQATQQQMSALLDAVMAVSSDLDLSVVLSRIVRSACELVDARYGALGVLAPHGERLVEFITHGMSEPDRERIGDLPHGHGILGLLIRDPQPRRIQDLTAHEDSFGFPPHHPPMHSFLGAPVRIRDQVYGNLYLAEKQGADEFSEDDEAILVALASAAGVAIENARLYDRSRRQRQLSEAVAELTQHLLEGGEQSAALRLMAQRSIELAEAELSVIALYDDQHRLVVRATSRPDSLDGIGVPLSPGRWDDIVAEREPLLLVSHAGEHSPVEATMIRELGPVREEGPTVLVTIAAGGAELGVLALAWGPDGETRAAESIEPMQQFASSAALALEAGSAQRNRSRMERLEDRDRIGRDMHDHVIQRLFATGLSLRAASRQSGEDKVRRRLDEAVLELDGAVKDIRATIFALHQPQGGAGLRAEIHELVRAAAQSLGFTPELVVDGSLAHLPPEHEAEVLAVVREGLANVVRHAHASWCQVCVGVQEQTLVRVEDDGVGLGETPARSGLVNLGQRAEQLGGSMTVARRTPQGTRIEWSVPLTREQSGAG